MPRPADDEFAKRYGALDQAAPEVKTQEAIRADCLLAFPHEHPGEGTEIAIDTKEFTCLCPWTGLPDFGTLRVRYVPDPLCLELKSLKYYLLSYRSVGIVQEGAANRILMDLVRACAPKRMTVVLDYEVRGGLHSVVTATHPPACGQ